MPASLPTAPAPKRRTTSPPGSSASPVGRTPASRARRSSSTPVAAPSPCTSPSITRRPLAMPTRSFRAVASAWPIAWRGATWRASAAFHTCRPPPPTPRWAPPHDRRSPDRGRPRLPRHPLPSPGPPARYRPGLRRPAGGGAARRRPVAAGPYRLRPPAPWRCTGGHARRPAAAAARAAPRSAPRRYPANEHGARAAAPRPAGRRHHHSCLRCRRTGGGASSRQPLAPAHRARLSARGAGAMSTAGQGVGGIVGAIAGAILGGPTGAMYGACPVAGNVVWLEGDKYRVKKKKSGGKGGGSVTTYKIFATFAVVLCEGPIVGLRRLWIGGNLVYDGGATATAGAIASGKSKSLWKLYTGTDTQQPDPRYQADKGVNATSGFPGLAYLVFYDLPLDKYGNSLAGAQIKAEVVTSGSTTYAEILAVPDTGKQFQDNLNPGLGKPYVRKMVDDIIYVNTVDGTVDYMFTSSGVYKGIKTPVTPAIISNVTVGPDYYYCLGAFGGSYLWSQASGSVIATNNLVIGYSPSVPDRTIGHNLPDATIPTIVMASDNAAIICMTNYHDGTGYKWYELDAHGVVLASGYHTFNNTNSFTVFGLSRGGGAYGHFGSACYDRTSRVMMCAYGAGIGDMDVFTINADGTLTKILDNQLENWNFTFPTCYVVGRTALAFSRQGYNLCADSMTINAIGLDEIVETECLQSNLLASPDLDVTALAADTVRGFRVSDTGPIRASLEPLSMIWPFDCRMHGHQLEFVRRGGASVASVPAADLDARMEEADPGPLLTLPRDMD